jgi:ABC-type dipeptide/oligopeptide/nickel transport system permease component
VQVGRFWDGFGKLFTLLGLSLPSFLVGLLLILVFSVYLGWLPSSGFGGPWHLIMPAFALGWYFAASHMRLTRSSMLEVLGSEYIKLARLKGLPQRLIIAKHAFKNALIPVLTLAGIMASVQVGRFWDGFGKLFTLLGLSLPSFLVGLLLILVFSVYLGWLPSSGAGTPLHLIMPAFALGWYFAASHMRLTRSSMLEVLGSEYIKLARLKGLPQRLVIAKHAFKNALIPVLTLAGINLVIMVNVAVVVETVFAWPGIGRLLYEGITFRDFPVVQGVVIMGGAMIVMVNFFVDVLYAVIDPRIRLEK